MFKWLIIIHVLGATIWVGGHLLLCLRYLPEALKKKDPEIIKAFEKKYEIIGMPSLFLQVITGVWMALSVYGVYLFGFSNPVETAISIKLILLIAIILLALDVRIFIFPRVTKDNLWWLALHIIAVTIISLLFLYYGIAIRFGGV
ncbi:MAG: copper resistance protein CopD [Flavobacteriales bacterium]|nr:copper resistance protein CopD [Flavobacteriales bacterium]